jgi:hypothetical protein
VFFPIRLPPPLVLLVGCRQGESAGLDLRREVGGIGKNGLGLLGGVDANLESLGYLIGGEKGTGSAIF